MSGVIHAVIVTSVIAGAQIFLPPTRFGHALERAPCLVTFGIKLLVYGTVIVPVFGGRLGSRLVAAVLLSPELAEWCLQAGSFPSALSLT